MRLIWAWVKGRRGERLVRSRRVRFGSGRSSPFRPGVAIFIHRRGCAAFERGDARSANRFGRHEPDQPVAALTDCADALALHVLEKGVLLGAIDLPEAEIVLVLDGHFSVPSWLWRRGRERCLVDQCSPIERSSSNVMRTRRSIA